MGHGGLVMVDLSLALADKYSPPDAGGGRPASQRQLSDSSSPNRGLPQLGDTALSLSLCDWAPVCRGESAPGVLSSVPHGGQLCRPVSPPSVCPVPADTRSEP